MLKSEPIGGALRGTNRVASVQHESWRNTASGFLVDSREEDRATQRSVRGSNSCVVQFLENLTGLRGVEAMCTTIGQPLEPASVTASRTCASTQTRSRTASRGNPLLDFAHKNDVSFRLREYAPGAPEGQHLLAHELAHIV